MLCSDVNDREHPRYAHEAAIVFVAEGVVSVEGRTHNVSRGGLCAELADPLPVGANVAIEIRLVFDDERQSEPLKLPARIVWCTAVDDAYQVGVSFHSLTEELSTYLGMFLRYLDDGSRPSRTRRESTLDKRFG